jgi:hypothetical protein
VSATHDDPDVLCLVCGLRTYSGCTCTRPEPTRDEIEAAREERLTRAERHDQTAERLRGAP